MDTANTERILLRMPLETTIKVDRDLRDRINAAARAQRMTPARFLDVLLEDHEAQRWAEAAVAELAAAPAEVRAEELRAARSMDATLADGLGAEPPYPREPGDWEPLGEDAAPGDGGR